jgi:hypothetical protein
MGLKCFTDKEFRSGVRNQAFHFLARNGLREEYSDALLLDSSFWKDNAGRDLF